VFVTDQQAQVYSETKKERPLQRNQKTKKQRKERKKNKVTKFKD